MDNSTLREDFAYNQVNNFVDHDATDID